MKVVIAGSRRLPRGYASRILVLFLAALPEDTIILLRRGAKTKPGHFEVEVEHLATALGFPIEWHIPAAGSAREGTFARDIGMVGAASLVLAFICPNEALSGTSGTQHVVEKALDQLVPVYTYTVDESGKVSRWGENDPNDDWSARVPNP